MLHLTETGLHAGRLLCEGERRAEDQHAHAVYAPLHLSDFRARTCANCLRVWAREAYDEGEAMPAWVGEMRC